MLGGGLAVKGVPDVLVHGTTFTNNAGAGAGVFAGDGTRVDIWKCRFEGNTAWHDNFEKLVERDQAFGAVQMNGGAAIQAQGSVVTAGGAILATQGSNLGVDIGWFYQKCGGLQNLRSELAFVDFWIPRLDPALLENDVVCNLPGSVFFGNVAYSGGAILAVESSMQVSNQYIDTPDVLPASVPVLFRNNTALSGGALTGLLSTPTTWYRAVFSENTAMPSAIPGPLACLRAFTGLRSTPITWYRAELSENTALPSAIPGPLAFLNSSYSNLIYEDLAHTAVFGGGLFLDSSVEQCIDPDNCWQLLITPILSLTGEYINGSEPVIRDNTAIGGAGGAIYMNQRGIMATRCLDSGFNHSFDVVDALDDDTDNLPCMAWTGNMAKDGGFCDIASSPVFFKTGNTAKEGGFGDIVASSPVFFKITQPVYSHYNSGNDITFAVQIFDQYYQYDSNSGNDITFAVQIFDQYYKYDYNSGNDITFAVQIFDQYYQTPPQPQSVLGPLNSVPCKYDSNSGNDITFDVQIFDQYCQVSGQVNDSNVNDRRVTSLRLISTPGEHNLDITVRHCRLGEISVLDFTICERCRAGFFSLNPQGFECTICPENAQCNMDREISGIIVPDPGFFNSNPYSAQIHECASEVSCDFVNRQELLTQYQANLINDPSVLSILYLVLINFFTFLILAVTSFLTLERQDDILRDDVPVTTIIKVFISYLQIISILKDLDLAYPEYLLHLWDVLDTLVSIPGTLTNTDCALISTHTLPNVMQTILLKVFSPVYVIIAWALLFMLTPLSRPLRRKLKCCINDEIYGDSGLGQSNAPSRAPSLAHSSIGSMKAGGLASSSTLM
eukprot:gene23618-9144_t